MTTAAQAANPDRFANFVRGVTRVVDALGDDEPRLLDAAAALLGDLVRHDDWLPERFAVPSEASYRQYLLYREPSNRFSVVSFVWQPGQKTPVHDHTVWGLVGVMRGEELCEEYRIDAAGLHRGGTHRLPAGKVDRVSPRIGDVHRVSNAGRTTAISIHVYGADIGTTRRHVFDESTGAPTEFVSGYSNGDAGPLLPSIDIR
jgi:predicted metal-dependent enzyme (double-stranded beta helix superfamily)